jgi:hypothetical protein
VFDALKLYLPVVTPLEEIKVNKRKVGEAKPSSHAKKSRECRAHVSEGVRKLRTLVQEGNVMRRMSIPDILEWGEYTQLFHVCCIMN